MSLAILEKLVKKKQISLNSYFGCPLSFNKAKNDSKRKKTFSSSIILLLKYKTADARNYYSTIKIENMQLLFAAKCLHNLESTLKALSILKKIGFLNQPISVCPTELITHEPHIKKIVSLLV